MIYALHCKRKETKVCMLPRSGPFVDNFYFYLIVVIKIDFYDEDL